MSTGAHSSSSRTINAFTVDVEDYFQVAALAGAIARESWSSREYRVESNTERLLALLAEHRVRGTFFVLGWVAQRSPALVRRIAQAGHEIGCHGFSHELVYRQSPKVFRNETACAKSSLEDTCGAGIRGYRAASFSVTRQSLWALDVLLELGFEYDTSIFPIRHDRYGIPDAPAEINLAVTPAGGRLLEFPMCTAPMLGLRVPVCGGGYFRLFPYWVTRTGLARINSRCGRPFPFYVHPWEIDPGQPRVAVGPVSRLRHYTNLRRCEGRLRRLLRDFAFAPMRDVLQSRGFLESPATIAPSVDT